MAVGYRVSGKGTMGSFQGGHSQGQTNLTFKSPLNLPKSSSTFSCVHALGPSVSRPPTNKAVGSNSRLLREVESLDSKTFSLDLKPENGVPKN